MTTTQPLESIIAQLSEEEKWWWVSDWLGTPTKATEGGEWFVEIYPSKEMAEVAIDCAILSHPSALLTARPAALNAIERAGRNTGHPWAGFAFFDDEGNVIEWRRW